MGADWRQQQELEEREYFETVEIMKNERLHGDKRSAKRAITYRDIEGQKEHSTELCIRWH